METIERILGHEIPILPEPFLPESELRPLTEADYQRLFEEFCAAPISTLPPEFWTETTTDKPVSITPAEETQARPHRSAPAAIISPTRRNPSPPSKASATSASPLQPGFSTSPDPPSTQ